MQRLSVLLFLYQGCNWKRNTVRGRNGLSLEDVGLNSLMLQLSCAMCEKLQPALQTLQAGCTLPCIRCEVCLKYPRMPQWWASHISASIC